MKRLAAALIVLLAASAAHADEVSEAETKEWAAKCEEWVKKRDAGPLDKAFDMDAIVTRAFAGLDVTAGAKKEFSKSLAERPLGSNIVQSLGAGGTWKFVRAGTRDGARVAVFRFITEQQSFDWKELFLEKDAKGALRVVDLFTHLAGERVTSILRRGALLVAVAENKELLEKLQGAEADRVKFGKEVAAIAENLRAKKPKEAIAAFKKLPASLKKDRDLLLLRWQAAQMLDDATELKAALDEIGAVFKNDAGLILYDRAIAAQDWKKALELLDGLEKVVGADAFIDFQRSCMHNGAGDRKASRASVEKALEREPSLVIAIQHALGLAMEEKDWPGVKKGLERLDEQGVALNDLATVPEFADFVKTKEYADWKKAREAKKKPKK